MPKAVCPHFRCFSSGSPVASADPSRPLPSRRRQLLPEANEWVRFPFSECPGSHSPAGSPPRSAGRASCGASLTCLRALRGVKRKEGMPLTSSLPHPSLSQPGGGECCGSGGYTEDVVLPGPCPPGAPHIGWETRWPSRVPSLAPSVIRFVSVGSRSGGRAKAGRELPLTRDLGPRLLRGFCGCRLWLIVTASTRGSLSSPAGLCGSSAFSRPRARRVEFARRRASFCSGKV